MACDILFKGKTYNEQEFFDYLLNGGFDELAKEKAFPTTKFPIGQLYEEVSKREAIINKEFNDRLQKIKDDYNTEFSKDSNNKRLSDWYSQNPEKISETDLEKIKKEAGLSKDSNIFKVIQNVKSLNRRLKNQKDSLEKERNVALQAAREELLSATDKNSFANVINRVFGLNPEQSNAVAGIADAMSKAWGRRFTKNPSDFYKLFSTKKSRIEELQTSNSLFQDKKTFDNEVKEVEERTKKDGTFMKAPNGKDTNLSEGAWLVTKTPTFKNWFGNSKIVDENGEPKVMYHGASKEWYEYDGTKSNSKSGFSNLIFLTPNYEFAEDYGSYEIKSLFAKSEKTFDYENQQHLYLLEQQNKHLHSQLTTLYGEVDNKNNWVVIERPIFQKFLKDNGFDGFYIKENGVKNLSVYNQNQIKNVDGNKSYNPYNNDIRFQSSKRTLTKDENGNYVFFHVTNTPFSKIKSGIDSTKGGSIRTSKQERNRASLGIASYYTQPNEQESMINGEKYKVTLKPSEVYDANKDEKGFAERIVEDRTISPYEKTDKLRKLLIKEGYKMLLNNWMEGDKNFNTRADALVPLKPEKITGQEKFNTGKINFQKEHQAAFQIMQNGERIIHALTNPNVSSPVHELAHLWEEFLTDDERKSILDWSNHKEWSIDTSENFARGFEKYLSEGKAPNSALQDIFDKFKNWLLDIYKSIVGSDIDVELNDDMRKVYATMLGIQFEQNFIDTKTNTIQAGKRLFNKPNPETFTIMKNYKSENGIETSDGINITKLDINFSKRLADAYENMKHEPNNPLVKEAYSTLANETKKQFKSIIDKGYNIELYDGEGEPYKNSEEMINDLINNKHLFVFSTEEGYGEKRISDNDREENPLLKDSEFKDKNGKTLLNNDLFRFVHDFFGHSERGNSFGALGEENAWDVHARMFSPLARRAMTTETRGQNSWVNFGKHMRNEDGSIKKLGDVGFLDVTTRPFAEQKIGLLPQEFSEIKEIPIDISKLSATTDYLKTEKFDATKLSVSQFNALQTAIKDNYFIEAIKNGLLTKEEAISYLSLMKGFGKQTVDKINNIAKEEVIQPEIKSEGKTKIVNNEIDNSINKNEISIGDTFVNGLTSYEVTFMNKDSMNYEEYWNGKLAAVRSTTPKEFKAKIKDFTKQDNNSTDIALEDVTKQEEAPVQEQSKAETPKVEAGSVDLGGDVEGKYVPSEKYFKNPTAGDKPFFYDEFPDDPRYLVTDNVAINNIVPTQKEILSDKVMKSYGTNDAKPELIKVGDKYYVFDGHHRIANDILNNRQETSANIFDLDKAKADGSYPNFVKDVESLIKEQPTKFSWDSLNEQSLEVLQNKLEDVKSDLGGAFDEEKPTLVSRKNSLEKIIEQKSTIASIPITRENVKISKSKEEDGVQVVKSGDILVGEMYFDRSLHNAWLDYNDKSEKLFADILGYNKEEAIQELIRRYNEKGTEQKSEPVSPTLDNLEEKTPKEVKVKKPKVEVSPVEEKQEAPKQEKSQGIYNSGDKVYYSKELGGQKIEGTYFIRNYDAEDRDYTLEDENGDFAKFAKAEDLSPYNLQDKGTFDKNNYVHLSNIAARLKEMFPSIQYKIAYFDGNWKGRFNHGVVEINALNATKDTPIHEFMHPFLFAIREKNPLLYENLKKDLLENHKDYLKEVNKDSNYKGLTEEDKLDEAMVRFLGNTLADAFDENGLIDKTKLDAKRGIKDYIYEFIKLINDLIHRVIKNVDFNKFLKNLNDKYEGELVFKKENSKDNWKSKIDGNIITINGLKYNSKSNGKTFFNELKSKMSEDDYSNLVNNAISSFSATSRNVESISNISTLQYNPSTGNVKGFKEASSRESFVINIGKIENNRISKDLEDLDFSDLESRGANQTLISNLKNEIEQYVSKEKNEVLISPKETIKYQLTEDDKYSDSFKDDSNDILSNEITVEDLPEDFTLQDLSDLVQRNQIFTIDLSATQDALNQLELYSYKTEDERKKYFDKIKKRAEVLKHTADQRFKGGSQELKLHSKFLDEIIENYDGVKTFISYIETGIHGLSRAAKMLSEINYDMYYSTPEDYLKEFSILGKDFGVTIKDEPTEDWVSKIEGGDLLINKANVGETTSTNKILKHLKEDYTEEDFIKLHDLSEQARRKQGTLSQDKINELHTKLREALTLLGTYDDISPLLKEYRDFFTDEELGEFDTTLGIVLRKKEDINNISVNLVAEWLYPTFDESQQEIIRQNPKDKDKIYKSKEQFKWIIKQADQDTTALSYWLGAAVNSRDPLLAVSKIALVNQINSNREHEDENLNQIASIFTDFLNEKGLVNKEKELEEYYKQNYLREAKVYEKVGINEDGSSKYDYVNRWAFHEEYLYDEYDKSYNTFIKSLPEALTQEQQKANQDAKFNWVKENTIVLENGVSKPSDKYKNSKFTELYGKDKMFTKIYDTYKQSNEKFGEKKLQYGIVPQVANEKGILKQFNDLKDKAKENVNGTLSNGDKTKFQKLKDLLVKGANYLFDKEERDYRMLNLSNDIYRSIPASHTIMLDSENIDFLLHNTVNEFLKSANSYSSLREVQSNAENLKMLVQGNPEFQVNARKISKTSKDGSKVFDKIWSKPLDKEEYAKKLNRQLVHEINDVLYDEPEEQVYLKLGAVNINANKLTSKIGLYTAAINMAGNVLAGAKNVSIGNINNLVEGIGGKYYTSSDYGWATKEYFSNIGNFSKDVFSPIKSKQTQLATKYDAIQGEFRDEHGAEMTGSFMKKYFKKSTLFIINHIGEHQIQISSMLALMKATKVNLKDGSETNLYDAYVNDGKGYYKIREDAQWTEQQERRFINLLHEINRQNHGNYSDLHKSMAQRNFVLKLALQYRKFLYEGYRSRFSSQRIDYARQELSYGYYRQFLKKFGEDLGNYRFDLLYKASKREDLTEQEKYAVKRTLAEAKIFASAIGLTLLLGGLGDDDNKARDYALVLTTGAFSDMNIYLNPIGVVNEATRIYQNPTASGRSLVNISDFLNQLYLDTISMEFEEYSKNGTGYEQGDSKLGNKFQKLIPVFPQFNRLEHPEYQLKYYQMIKQNVPNSK